jgi:DNA (cytosine-5)-methyltransferase 1
MLRVISEIKPTWVLGENVAGLINMALDQVLSDLESQGYTTLAFNIPAAAVNAPHRRERVFIVAYSDSSRCIHRESEEQTKETGEHALGEFIERSSNVFDTTSKRFEEINYEARDFGERETKWESWTADSINGHVWDVEPNVGRVANGVPEGVDRLKCLGNAVVPQQAYPIFKAIAEVENARNDN